MHWCFELFLRKYRIPWFSLLMQSSGKNLMNQIVLDNAFLVFCQAIHSPIRCSAFATDRWEIFIRYFPGIWILLSSQYCYIYCLRYQCKTLTHWCGFMWTCHSIGSPLIQVMDWRVFREKLSTEPVVTYCPLSKYLVKLSSKCSGKALQKLRTCMFKLLLMFYICT